MFSEILKIIPKVSGGDLQAMERGLNQRFARVAKKFGGGLMTAIKGGGITGLAIGLIDRVLNPLKQVQEAIDKSLHAGDDLETFAKQFNTSAGSLARLQAFGQAKGLDPETLRFLVTRFQSAVAQAAADPGTPSAVSKFVGKGDTAEAFFEFVQALQKMTPIQQNLAQLQVFGEREINKAAEFLHADFAFLNRQIGGPSADQLTGDATKLGTLNEAREIIRARRELNDLHTKAALITPKAVMQVDRGEQLALNQENKNLTNIESLQKLSNSVDKLTNLLQDAFVKASPYLTRIVPQLVDGLVGGAAKVAASRAARGIVPGAGKDK